MLRGNMVTTTVGAVILDRSGEQPKVLLTQRNVEPFKGRWCLPGGHIERYETAAEAVLREVREETGLDFRGAFMDWFEEIYPDLDVHNVVLMYRGEAAGELAACEREVSDIGWFPLSQARTLPLAFCHQRVLEDLAL